MIKVTKNCVANVFIPETKELFCIIKVGIPSILKEGAEVDISIVNSPSGKELKQCLVRTTQALFELAEEVNND